MKNPRFLTLTALVFAVALSRVIPHPWNISPVAAMALFGGAHFTKKWQAFVVPLTALLMSDMFLGFYREMWAIYASFALIVLIGAWLKKRKSAGMIGVTALSSSFVFFVLTNAATWAFSGLYPKTGAGFAACFIAAIPFFQNTLIGDLFFTAVLFGSFAWAERRSTALQESFAS